MDTFTFVVALTTLAFVYFGERFKAGVYLILASMFAILLAWRMAEVVYYIGTGALIVTLIFRAFFANEDIRENSNDE
jgi:hypothetical protein